MRDFKVNITETILRHVWVRADDPDDAVDKAERRYCCKNGEPLEVSYDVDMLAKKPCPNKICREDFYDEDV